MRGAVHEQGGGPAVAEAERAGEAHAEFEGRKSAPAGLDVVGGEPDRGTDLHRRVGEFVDERADSHAPELVEVAWLHPAAGKLPEQRKRSSSGALGYQILTPVLLNHCSHHANMPAAHETCT